MKSFAFVFALVLFSAGAALVPQPVQAQAPAACDPTFGGKYSGLVRELNIPEDAAQYGSCHDYGAWEGTDYKGHTGLPNRAYWTYSAPVWYVWTNVNTSPPGATGLK